MTADFREHVRYHLIDLEVTRVTDYIKTVHREQEVHVWRYAFRRKSDGHKFVCTGVNKGFREGDVVCIAGTVRQSLDKYGFTRLQRITKIDKPQPELPL